MTRPKLISSWAAWSRSSYHVCNATLRPTTARLLPYLRNSQPTATQVRHLWPFSGKNKDREDAGDSWTPKSIADMLRNKPKAPEAKPEQPKLDMKRASLATTSIFDKEAPKEAQWAQQEEIEADAAPRRKEERPNIPGLKIDIDEITRKERLRLVKRRGVLTRKQQIAQMEKRHQAKSHLFKTSLKKLGPLARQIAGKSIADAKTQMRFSKKKAAKEVLDHLKQAEAEAAVNRNFDLKNTYVSEAWVGRGTPDKELERRAMGRINILTKPYTSITVVLKEEKTKQRVAQEKEAKRWRRKPWVQLPNRPIQGQHQYYTW